MGNTLLDFSPDAFGGKEMIFDKSWKIPVGVTTLEIKDLKLYIYSAKQRKKGKNRARLSCILRLGAEEIQVDYGIPGEMEVRIGGVEVAKGLSFEHAGVRLEASGSRIAVAVFGTLLLELKDTLRFTSELSVEPNGTSIAGTLQEEWINPFGIQGVSLKDVALTIGTSFQGIPTVGLSGKSKIGKFEGSLGLLFNSKNPSASMLSLEYNKLPLQTLFDRLLSSKVEAKIPQEMRQLLGEGFEDVVLYLVPQTTSIGEICYEAGLHLKGTLKLLGMQGQAEAKIMYSSGILAYGALSPVKLGQTAEGHSLFQLTGAQTNLFKLDPSVEKLLPSPTGGPQFRISLNTEESPTILLSARIEFLNLFHQETLINLTTTGAVFTLTYKEKFTWLTLGCVLKHNEFQSKGSFGMKLKRNIRIKDPITKRELTQISLDTELLGEMEIQIGPRIFTSIVGHFKWNGVELEIPKMTLTDLPTDVETLQKLIMDAILEQAHSLFSPRLFNKSKT
ncbi:hypothetical protein WDW89_10220 [Deltaproteobacteria bacterium TL4]